MQQATRNTLKLFVDKVETLKRRNIVKFMQERDTTIEPDTTTEPDTTIAAQEPPENAAQEPSGNQVISAPFALDEEAVHALANTVRFFIPHHAGSSSYDLTRAMDDKDVSQNWKDQYAAVAAPLLQLLSHPPSGVYLAVGETQLTCRIILEMFLQGRAVEGSKNKLPLYEQWKQSGLLFPLMELALADVIASLGADIFCVAQACELELSGEPVPPFKAGGN